MSMQTNWDNAAAHWRSPWQATDDVSFFADAFCHFSLAFKEREEEKLLFARLYLLNSFSWSHETRRASWNLFDQSYRQKVAADQQRKESRGGHFGLCSPPRLLQRNGCETVVLFHGVSAIWMQHFADQEHSFSLPKYAILQVPDSRIKRTTRKNPLQQLAREWVVRR